MLVACGESSAPKKVGQPQTDPDPIFVQAVTLPAFPTEPTEPPEPEEPPGPTYGLDDALRLNEIQMKGSHNSYHVRPNNNEEAWAYDLPPIPVQLDYNGVRAFELDVHYMSGRFAILHLSGWDDRSTCPWLEDCLQQIRSWSEAHPGHAPIIIYYEIKDQTDPQKVTDHMDQFEQTLVDNWPREKIFTPDDLTGSQYPDVQSAIKAKGWPTLGEVRGKVIMVLHAFGLAPHLYTNGGNGLWGKRMFVTDVDMHNRHAGFLAMDEPVENEWRIKDYVARGFMVRTRSDDLPTFGGNRWVKLDAALRSGAHVILTDYPEAYYIQDYAVYMPGGTPMRCNPITAPRAPGACTSEAIENPLLLKIWPNVP
jgi:hypothetical protein